MSFDGIGRLVIDKRALAGIKVLDFGWVLAAPLATKQLAVHGATVIKVESSLHPDTVRLYAPNAGGIRGINRCGAFSAYNDDKMSIALDLRKPKALAIVEKLVAWCDIVVENFSPGFMEKRGLGWDNLKQINPDVIMIRISMQGQTGPRSSIPGFGGAFQSQTGIIELVGWPDREPDLIPIAFTDHVLPWYAAFVAVAALEYRDRTGRGLCLDIGQYETGLNCLIPAALDYTVNGKIWTRSGNRLPHACPHGVYQCQGDDRWVAIAVFSDGEWHTFTRVIGEPEWTKAPKFTTFLSRKQNEDELDQLVESWTVNHSAEDVMKRMQEAGIAAGLVETNKDLHEDPQLAHRNHFVRLHHPEMGLCAYDAPPFRLSKTPAELKSASPCLGEHTAYVCTEILGMSDEEFIQLSEEGIFR